jgi:hypothetical protein
LLCAANDLTIRVNTLADWLDQVAAYAICADVARFTALPGWTPRVLGPGHIDCRRGNDVDCDWVCHYPDGTWGCQRDGRVVQGKANAQEAWDAAGKVQ